MASESVDKVQKPVSHEAAWDFYRRIGSPKYVAAPMVDQSELPFRLLCRRYGAQLCYTPMFNAQVFLNHEIYRSEEFQTCAEDRPLFAQFCGDDPDTILAAARLVEDKVDAIDLNFGCPQGIAKRGNYGAYLLTDIPLMQSLVRKLHNNLSIPVTCKIRLLPTEEESIAVAKALEEAGCSILTVHGRTKEQKKQFVGPTNFDTIRKIRAAVRIPVFANGGVATLDDVHRIMDITQCDGVMSSEGLLCNPCLFHGFRKDGIEMTQEYLRLVDQYGASNTAPKAHIFKFLHQKLTRFPDWREYMGRRRELSAVQDVIKALLQEEEKTSPEELYRDVEHWYSRHLGHKPEQLARAEKAAAEKAATRVTLNLQEFDSDSFVNLFTEDADPCIEKCS